MAESNSLLTLGVNKDNAVKNLLRAFITGVVIITITIIVIIISVSSSKPILGIDAWAFIDVVLLSILTYGIYMENKTAAVIMAVLWPLEKIAQFASLNNVSPTTLAFSVIFEIAFIRGAIATFILDKNSEKKKHNQIA